MKEKPIELEWDDSTAEDYENGELLDRRHRYGYLIKTPREEEFYCSVWNLELWSYLWDRCGNIPIAVSSECVPVSVAIEGRGSMAAYLQTVHQLRRREIAELMGISRASVRQYISDFRRGER